MNYLRGLQLQLKALQLQYQEAMESGATLEEVKPIYFKIKGLRQTIYEYKIKMKRNETE